MTVSIDFYAESTTNNLLWKEQVRKEGNAKADYIDIYIYMMRLWMYECFSISFASRLD